MKLGWLLNGAGERLRALMFGIIILQYSYFLAEYWYKNTEHIVQLSLLLVLIVQLAAPRVNQALQTAIYGIGVIWIHHSVLGLSWPDGATGSREAFGLAVRQYAESLNPYCWFAFGAVAAYMLALRTIKSKWIILTLTAETVVLFAVFDSFNAYYLWEQVALVIMSGLVLTVISHFEQFKLKHPAAWDELRQYPSNVLLPVTLLISIVMISGVLMPSIDPLVTDPYTAWRKWQGGPVPTGIKPAEQPASSSDSDDPAEDSGLIAASGYSRDDSALGGGFNYDYTPIMEVTSSYRGYWRGETRTIYTSSGWATPDYSRTSQTFNLRMREELPETRFDISKLETEQVKQTFTMLEQEQYPVLFASYALQEVESLGAAESDDVSQQTDVIRSFMWSDEEQVLRTVPESSAAYPEQYEVVSAVPMLDEEGLRSVLEPFSRDDAGMRMYLQLPGSLPQRVKQLAADIAKEQSNPYDQVKAIEAYLAANYTYTNTPNDSAGSSDDFVDRFLFEVKEGYCDYFSTAMVVLTRSLDIPARWVKGYAPGDLPFSPSRFLPGGLEFEENSGGTFTVRNSDAHSWVEVYFQGYGWIPFEPTPGFTMPLRTAPDAEALPAAAASDSSAESAETSVFSWINSRLVLLLGVLLLAAALLLYLRRGGMPRLLRGLRHRSRKLTADEQIVDEVVRFLDYARRKGLRREDHETMRETISRWSAEHRFIKDDLALLLTAFEQAKYGSRSFRDSDVESFSEQLNQLRKKIA